jgi:hypothetical protein
MVCCRDSSNHQQHSVGSLGIFTGKVERVSILVLLYVLLGVPSLSLLLSFSADRTSEFGKRAGSS